MSIEVKIPQTLSRFTNNQLIFDVNGNTVGECLDHLVEQFPDLKSALFDHSGRMYRYLDIYVNKESTYPETLAKPVKDGDTIFIMLLVFGG